jgi:hypothetical protein
MKLHAARKTFRNKSSVSTSMENRRVASFARRLKEDITQLNLFVNQTTRTDPNARYCAIISTRAYIALLAISITILITYNLLLTETEIITIRNPSEKIYHILSLKYSSTLSCPCSHITILYKVFSSMTIEYHQVCSSMFVSDQWIKYLFNSHIGKWYQRDYRLLASSHFQMLSSLCIHVSKTVDNGVDDFLSESFLTQVVLASEILDSILEEKRKFLQQSTENGIRQLLQLIRSTTLANQFQNALQTSKRAFMFAPNYQYSYVVVTGTSFLNSNETTCSCYTEANCSMPSGFFPTYRILFGSFRWDTTISDNLTGIVLGCYMIESVLQSKLECFFDASCLQLVLSYFSADERPSVNPSKQVRHNLHQTLLSKLWFINCSSRNGLFTGIFRNILTIAHLCSARIQ